MPPSPDWGRGAGPGRQIPWLWVVGGMVLLVFVGRGLVGAAENHGGTASSALVAAPTSTSAGTPTDSPALPGTSAPTATAPDGSAPATPSSAVLTVRPTTARPTTTRPATAAPGPSTVRPTTTPRPRPTVPKPTVVGSPIVGVQSGKCIDVQGGTAVDGAQIDVRTCDGRAAEAISYTSDGELRILGKCLDARGQSTEPGTPVILYGCNGQQNQVWFLAPDRTIRGLQSRLCLDAAGWGTADGTPLQLWSCSGGANQLWVR